MIAVSSLIYGMSVLLVTANLPRGLVGGRTWALGSLTLFGGWLLIIGCAFMLAGRLTRTGAGGDEAD